MTSNEALPEHAYYCFETIHSELKGSPLPQPDFDASEDLCALFFAFLYPFRDFAHNDLLLLQSPFRHLEHQVEKQRRVPLERMHREL
jgi:hypothetical protein